MTYVSYEKNFYYHPEASGLQTVGEVELSEPSYDFDLLVVWKKGSKFYVGQDSGCSCPSPFEEFSSLDDLAGPFTKSQVCKYLSDFKVESWHDENYYRPQIVDLIARIRAL